MRITGILFILIILTSSVFAFSPKWINVNNIDADNGIYTIKGSDPFMVSQEITDTIPESKAYMKITLKTSSPVHIMIYWWQTGQPFSLTRQGSTVVQPSDKFQTVVIDLNKAGRFKGLNTYRFGLINPPVGLKFELQDIDFITYDQVPRTELIKQCEFRAYTSKLHYPYCQTSFDYQASMISRNYPEKRSSKILTTSIIDSEGKTIATQNQQYGIASIQQRKVLYGTFNFEKPLKPGKYILKAVSKDQMTDDIFSWDHIFSVQTKDAPFVYETPFKFVKDFSIIRDQQGLWHVFSITGDFIEGHAWDTEGNERTFSHGTSKDLRNWTYHNPVISISDETYPDGNGKFKDQNVWAPHVIYHKGLYYMFYTSVNSHISQSVSLATSKDLFNWTEHDKNPVFTLENLDWATWGRTHWSDGRDPAIFKDGDTFYMLTTAHSAIAEPRGILSVAESKDLIHWTNPQIALRYLAAMESSQIWKHKDKYFMTTSAHGQGTWISDRPDKGWKKLDFPRPPVQTMEKDVPTSASYAEEVFQLEDTDVIASLTWRHQGNTIYISKIIYDANGVPSGYESPFKLPK